MEAPKNQNESVSVTPSDDKQMSNEEEISQFLHKIVREILQKVVNCGQVVQPAESVEGFSCSHVEQPNQIFHEFGPEKEGCGTGNG